MVSPMARETWVQSQVESYQRLKKLYLILPCLTLSIIRYRSRVKWNNPGKGVAPSLHLCVVAIKKGAFGLSSTNVANFTYFSSIWPIHWTLSGATTPSQSWPGSNGNERVLCISQSWSLTIRLFIVISKTLVGGCYPFAEMHTVYSIAPTDWTKDIYIWIAGLLYKTKE